MRNRIVRLASFAVLCAPVAVGAQGARSRKFLTLTAGATTIVVEAIEYPSVNVQAYGRGDAIFAGCPTDSVDVWVPRARAFVETRGPRLPRGEEQTDEFPDCEGPSLYQRAGFRMSRATTSGSSRLAIFFTDEHQVNTAFAFLSRAQAGAFVRAMERAAAYSRVMAARRAGETPRSSPQ